MSENNENENGINPGVATEAIPEVAPEKGADIITEGTAGTAPEVTTEVMAEAIPEAAIEGVPEMASETLPGSAPVETPEAKSEKEVNLLEKAPGIKKVLVGVGWDAPEKTDGGDVDIDLSAFLLTQENRVRGDRDFIFYNNLALDDGSITHHGDNPTGAGEGDDELITIDLEALPYEIQKVAFAVSVHNADERHQNFGIVKNAFIRIVDEENKNEVARFNLTNDASNETGMLFGEIERDMSSWIFRLVGQGTELGLFGIARDFGVHVAEP